MDRRAFLAASAALPFAPAAWARLGGGTPLALVTADLESHVVVVDPARGRVVRHIATEAGPRSIETIGGGTAVVAHTNGGAVSLLDGTGVRAVVRGFTAPRYTAAEAGGRYAYVTDSGRGEVAVLDAIRGEVVARLALGGPARHVSLSPSGRRLWIALGPKASELAVVDVRQPREPRLAARVRPPYLAHDVGFAPGGTVWVTSGDRGTIGVYDARGELRFRIDADAPPQHVTFAGTRAYVASGDDGTLRVHDAASGGLLRTTRVPVGSYNVQQGLGLVLTPSLDRGTLCVVRRSGALEHELRVARSSHDACLVTAR
jgi:DNA-binding beta-propeller fold protein YncE